MWAKLINNSRFYVLLGTFFISLLVIASYRLKFSSDTLYYIRAEQALGYLSVIYLYVALIVSPLGYIFGKRRSLEWLKFARRPIGVSAAYFAILHAGIALWGQLGGWSGLPLLPDRFVWSLSFGLVALVVLFLLAITSFDKVITWMTFPRWKWLHRLVYASGILLIIHIWLIGTFAADLRYQLLGFVALSVLFGLELWRITGNLAKRFADLQAKELFITLFMSLWLLSMGALLLLPFVAGPYHSNHQNTGVEHGHKK